MERQGLCKHIKSNGESCRAHALKGGEYCFFHEPTKAGERGVAQSKGGKNSNGKARLHYERVDNLSCMRQLLVEGEIYSTDFNTRTIGILLNLARYAMAEMETLGQRLSAIEHLISKGIKSDGEQRGW